MEAQGFHEHFTVCNQRPRNHGERGAMRPTIFSSIRECGLRGYLWGVGYRVVMRLAHRYNWHYAKPNHWLEPGKIYLWCQWCGFRGSVPDMRHPSNKTINVGRFSSTTPASAEGANAQKAK